MIENNDIKDKAIKGASWSLAGDIIKNLISFIIGTILVNILIPTEYDIVGIVILHIFIIYVCVNQDYQIYFNKEHITIFVCGQVIWKENYNLE